MPGRAFRIVAFTVLVGLLWTSWTVAQTDPGAAAPSAAADVGTARMAQTLREIADASNVRFNSFLNHDRARMIASVPEPEAPADRVRYLFMLGSEQLLSGRSEEATSAFETVLELVAEHGDSQPPLLNEASLQRVKQRLALSYLRLGEEENCIGNPNTDRCLVPIRGAGVHENPRGSRAAIEAYTRLLETQPSLGDRWLLNLAYMTLGEYPDKVPTAWLIPAEAFESEHDIGRFADVAPSLGVDVFGLSGGAIMEDFDGDGLLDIMASGWGLREQIRLFLSDGEGTFTETTERARLVGITGGLNLKQADYDNDGDIDVFVLRGAWLREHGTHPNSLLRNNGDGTFSDVTEPAGLLSFHPTQTADWGDYDNDGWLDLFIGNESVEGSKHPAELFHNNGDGTFSNVAEETGAAVVDYIKGVAWGDLDNDGLLDLYVSNISAENLLLKNRGRSAEGAWRFENVAAAAGVAEPVVSFPIWVWDYDNDGWLDIFVSGYRANIEAIAAEYLGLSFGAERPRLYRNNGDGTFTDEAVSSGLDRVLYTMGCNFGDLDSDGYLDFYVGTGDTEFRSLMPNRMFRNDGGRRFQDVTTSGGFGHLQKGHGVAFGDLDNDGDQDLYAVMGGAHSGDGFTNVLFENPGHGNRWLTLRLEGVRSNRSAIGARIAVEIEESERDTSRTVYATVGSGASFGASSLQQEIGLGRAKRVVRVRIAWPGTVPGGEGEQVLEGLELDRVYRVRQGQSAVVLEVQPMRLGGDGPAGAARTHQHEPR